MWLRLSRLAVSISLISNDAPWMLAQTISAPLPADGSSTTSREDRLAAFAINQASIGGVENCWSSIWASLRTCRGGNAVSSQSKRARSEEHTSELQSLMRISYAVFCLKKKN